MWGPTPAFDCSPPTGQELSEVANPIAGSCEPSRRSSRGTHSDSPYRLQEDNEMRSGCTVFTGTNRHARANGTGLGSTYRDPPRNLGVCMRVRITRRLSGSVDGIPLGRFVTDGTYDVGTTLGNYLLAAGSAVPAESEAPPLAAPIQEETGLPQPPGRAIR